MVWKKHILYSNPYKSLLGRNWQLLLYTALQLGIFNSTVSFCIERQLGPVLIAKDQEADVQKESQGVRREGVAALCRLQHRNCRVRKFSYSCEMSWF